MDYSVNNTEYTTDYEQLLFFLRQSSAKENKKQVNGKWPCENLRREEQFLARPFFFFFAHPLSSFLHAQRTKKKREAARRLKMRICHSKDQLERRLQQFLFPSLVRRASERA